MKGWLQCLSYLFRLTRSPGTRDPYQVNDAGAGFVLSWQGNPKLLVGQKNEDKELIQVLSDSMLIAIPK